MTNRIDNILLALKKLKRLNLAKEFVTDNGFFFEELNREQLEKGQRSDNTFLPNYSNNSENQKRGRAGEPIKLFDTGDFYKGMDAVATNTGARIENRDSKDNKLSDNYGENIKGLSEESIQKVKFRFRAYGLNKVRQEINNSL